MKRAWILSLVSLFFLSLSLKAQATDGVSLGPKAQEQLRLIMEEKEGRTPAQKKIASTLLIAARRLDATAAGTVYRQIPLLPGGFPSDKAGRAEVEIAGEITKPLLERVASLGGTVTESFPEYQQLRAWIPLTSLEPLASLDSVRHIRPAWKAIVHKINTSQGDVAHKANLARASLGVDGSGVKVGVISDSVEKLAALQASSDLPAVTVMPGLAGSGSSEGTAMLEIVNDLAPGAQLFFATGGNSEPEFAIAVTALRHAGCKVIVDDIGYPVTESPFQDTLASQAAEAAVAAGVTFFSAAGNSGNRSRGQAGAWEGDFASGGPCVLGSDTFGTCHNFGGAINNQVLRPGHGVVSLWWSDALGHSGADYDLCAVDSAATTVLGCSTNTQDGDDDPIEVLTGVDSRMRLIVVNRHGAQPARFLHLQVEQGALQLGTSGSTHGHPASPGVLGVAAVNVSTAGGGIFVGGAANPVETFSSDGPRHIFFQADGSAITPGDFLSTGGTIRQKPDLAAADGVATASGEGFNPFFGTSAAAPHAAAVAALVLDANPALTPAQVKSILSATALDIMASGSDRDSGAGIVNALAAVQGAGGGGGTGPCVQDATTTCLLNGRFRAVVRFRGGFDNSPADSNAFRKPVTGFANPSFETAFFYFNSADNIEILLKMLDQGNTDGQGHPTIAVLFGSATPLRVEVTITDTQNGTTRTYTSPFNTQSGTTDFTAFLK